MKKITRDGGLDSTKILALSDREHFCPWKVGNAPLEMSFFGMDAIIIIFQYKIVLVRAIPLWFLKSCKFKFHLI